MKIKIEFEIELEDVEEYTEEQLEEFLRYTFRDNGCMSRKNPFYGQRGVDPIFGTFEWKELIERSEGMTSERIKEIQSKTAYPESVSVQQALLQVWNECEQEQSAKNRKIENIKPEFKRGDILIDAYDEAGAKYISILKDIKEDKSGRFSTHIALDIFDHCLTFGSPNWDNTENNRLATEEEKQLLFNALKKEGKRWNADKLKIETEFKRGDILASELGYTILIFDKYTSRSSFSSFINNHPMISNNGWYTPTFRYASIEEIEVFYKDLARMGKKWNAETLELEELDISEIVVDYESAIKYLGIKDTLLVFKNYDRADKFNAQIKLQLIAEAWNKFDGFEADWENYDQYKYFPTFRIRDGNIELSYVSFVIRSLNPYTSNFSFKTEERATQFGKQFIDLFKVALGF